MGKLITTIEDREVQALKDKLVKARKDQVRIREMREKCANAYQRQPLGIEKPKRSKVTASTVLNQVEGVHPNLMKRYLATDHRVSIIGPDMKIAKGLKVWARERITDQGSFRLMNDVIKDGMVYSNGTAKVWWQRLWERPVTGERILTEAEMMKLAANREWSFQKVEPIPRRKATVIDMGDDVSVLGEQVIDPKEIEVVGDQMYRCICSYSKLLESNPVIIPIPPEEFIAEHGKTRMNDRKGCGHIRTMMAGELVRENERLSVPGRKHYTNLKRALESPRIDALSEEKQEREVREAPLWDYTDYPEETYSSEELRKVVVVIEWADYLVINGKLVPCIITFCNSEVIRVEENEDGIIGMMTWSPMVVSHSIYGFGVGWLHADEQNVQTVLTRAVLDSVAFSIDKPRLIKQRNADLLGLQDLYPGKLVVGQEGDYKDIDAGTMDFRILQAIEFLKGETEERGPGTRYNMGTDSDTLNSTATGVSLIQRAGLNKVDMIALAFSELFLVDAYNKLIFLAQRNLDLPVEVVVDGEKIMLTRENIQGDYRARGDIGLDVDFDDRAFQKAIQMMSVHEQIANRFPMLYTVESGREHLRRIFAAAGEKDMSILLPPVPEYAKGWFPGKEQMEMQAAQMAQMQQEQLASAAGSPAGGPGAPGVVPATGGPPPQVGSGIPEAEPRGRDYVAGQGTAQPDETMLEMS